MDSHDEFYITTPIYYVNDKPHIGHAYSTIVADTLARWREARGEHVVFSTGVDENSQKTVDAAKKNDEEIHAYVDRLANVWASTWSKLGISNTDFIRTTEERHIETVNDIWGRMEAAGDIYKGQYEGLYCKGHEAFMKEDELTPDGLCPEHKVAPELVTEENYFFKLSNYQQRLLEFYDAHGEFVAPAHRFNEVRAFVENGLEDISFSREKKEWGIPVPNDPNQVIYVWADALVNYITAVGVEGWEEHPADVHVMAKDIVRFHAVIWPAMLMSAGLPLPGQVISTGFLTVDGVKMSKSLSNGVDPLELAARYGNDAVRYFLLREVSFGDDGDFSEAKMKERYNADLANGLGNFAARVLTLAEKEGELDLTNFGQKFDIANFTSLIKNNVFKSLNNYRFNDALTSIWNLLSLGDKYVNDNKIWMESIETLTRRQSITSMVFLLNDVAEMLIPFMPETAKKISNSIEIENNKLHVKKPDILFPRIK
jgi:methionyl-tRNA synthetase